MARIAGVNIPTKKRVETGLTYIYGIGHTSANKICQTCNIPTERRVADLTEDELARIREMVDRDFMVEGEKRAEVGRNIKRKMDIACYQGLRHRRGLPVRGQGTKNNARTRKGPSKPVAGKKQA